MKNLSTIIISALFTCLLFSATLYSSCNEDKCEGITCQNGGSCKDGTCLCPEGYEGTRCETKSGCAGVNCLNGGKCVNGLCDCPEGFAGPRCETDLCVGITCNNGGHCFAGKCKCAEGYEGDKCDSLTRKRYIGIWVGKSSCSGSNTDSIVITAASTVGMQVYFSSGKLQYNVWPGIANGGLVMNTMANLGTDKMVSFNMTATGTSATYTYQIANLSTGIGINCSGTATKKK
jgi:hypothetical protein